MKSDDARRVRRMQDITFAYDPLSELEPEFPEAFDAQAAPYFFLPPYENPHHRAWPGSEEDMRERAPKDLEGPGPLSTRMALALALMKRV